MRNQDCAAKPQKKGDQIDLQSLHLFPFNQQENEVKIFVTYITGDPEI